MDVNPRKSPQQARAKATFEAIVEATIQLLLSEGFERFTTARVAERAGVSVGSLYQYFPNKTALAAAVVDRCCDEIIECFRQAFAERSPRSLSCSLYTLADTSLAPHHLEPELHRVMTELIPRLGMARRADRITTEITALIEGILREHAKEIAEGMDLSLAATLIESMMETVTERSLALDGGDRTAIRDEAVRMMWRYLKG